MATREETLLTTRGHFTPETLNEELRTVDLVWGTDDPAVMRSFWEDSYLEQLSFDKKHVDLSRLNNGAPLLNTHSMYGLDSVIGVVERATTDGKQGVATVRFSSREDVAPIWKDVQDGILRNVSVGYQVRKYEVTEANKKGSLPLKKAVDWLPMEISLVPIGKDSKAQIRSEDEIMEPTVETPIVSEEVSTGAVDSPTPTPATREEPPVEIRSEPDNAQLDAEFVARLARLEADKKAREQQIRAYCKAANCSEAYTNVVLASDMDARRAADKILSDLATNQASIRSTNTLSVTRPEGKHLVQSLMEAVSYRAGGEETLADYARPYREHSLLDCARAILQRNGTNTNEMSKSELVTRAISTSDFAILFTSLIGRRLLPAYEAEPQTWRPFSTQRNLPDFRPVTDVDLSANIVPEPLAEGGEYRESTFTTVNGNWQIQTYAKKFVVTRQAIINDDLNALARVPLYLGRGFSIFESNFIYLLLTCTSASGVPPATPVQGVGAAAVGARPIMDTAHPLFDATHSNLSTGTISVAGISAARLLLRSQTDIAGNRVMLTPTYLLIPPELETTAEVFFGNIFPTTVGQVNPFAGTGRLSILVEPRLSASSVTQYYVLASPSQIPMIEYGQLAGEAGPQITSMDERNPDGVTILCREDFGATILNWRGFVRSSGA